MAYHSIWKSSLWETDPEGGLHSYYRKSYTPSTPISYREYLREPYLHGMTIWRCTKCGAEIKTEDRKGSQPPSPKWGPHCAGHLVESVIEY